VEFVFGVPPPRVLFWGVSRRGIQKQKIPPNGFIFYRNSIVTIDSAAFENKAIAKKSNAGSLSILDLVLVYRGFGRFSEKKSVLKTSAKNEELRKPNFFSLH
jgi:hypothetical protein